MFGSFCIPTFVSRQESRLHRRRSAPRWDEAGSGGEAASLGEVQQCRFKNTILVCIPIPKLGRRSLLVKELLVDLIISALITILPPQFSIFHLNLQFSIFLPQGQICVAPDYVLCSPKLEAPLLTLLAKNLVTSYFNQIFFSSSMPPLGWLVFSESDVKSWLL